MKPNPKDFRVDARGKLRAEARYIRDEQIAGLWYGVTLRSPHPRARILSIDLDPQFDWNSVTVVTAKDVPHNYVAIIEKDMPVLAKDMVNYVGEPVALFAAPTQELAEEALKHVTVKYEPLPFIDDPLKAEHSEIKLYGSNNVFKEIHIERGHLQEARQAAFRAIELETRTGFQEHMYLEPQGMVAIPQEGRIVLKGSLQCPYYIKNALEQIFPDEIKITVEQATTGGAFGGKEDFPSLLAAHAALLAFKSGHPVAIFYDRAEDVLVTTKRHPSFSRNRVFVDRKGKILGLDIEFYLDSGAYVTLSPVVLARAALTISGCYFIPHVNILARAVATNTVPSGAFRGFGGPQAIFTMEMIVEEIARQLDLPPHKVREVNLIDEGQTTATGQVLKYSVSNKQTFYDVLERSDYQRKYARFKEHNAPILERLRKGQFPKSRPDDVLKGIGLSVFLHGAGFTGGGENRIKGKIRIELDENGRPVIFSAQTEMGQGQQTAFRKILADVLNIDREQVLLAPVNTDLVPNSGPTVASRTTMVVGSLIADIGQQIIERLTNELQKEYNIPFEYRTGYFYGGQHILSFSKVAKKFAGLCFEKEYKHPPFIKFSEENWKGDAYPVYSWAAAVAETEVDPITFNIKVTRYYTTHEIGKAINYDQSIAQIQGGSLQGIAYAVFEKMERQNGHFNVHGFSDYIIPTTVDMPVMDIKILENPYPFGPFGAKGLGEMPLVGAAPAVVSSLRMIFGQPINQIPVMPEDLFELVQNMKKNGGPR
ncbi:xanthine dehydrogenase family protein molybdopterin-binding subunit [Calditrichota bacterium GD2]